MNEENRNRRIRDKSAAGSTIIWEGSVIKGTLSGTDDYIVYGNVEGDADTQATLILQPGATWRGTITANNIVIAGTVDGDVTAKGKLELADTARVRGNITGKAVAIAEGAVFEGEIRMTANPEVSYFQDKRSTQE